MGGREFVIDEMLFGYSLRVVGKIIANILSFNGFNSVSMVAQIISSLIW